MNRQNDLTRFVDDLAGHWTDPALEVLKDAGIHQVSVDVEVATWRALRIALRAELRRQQSFRSSALVSLHALTEQVFRKATRLVAQTFEPQAVSAEFEKRVLSSITDRRSTAAERRVYTELVRLPALHAAFKPPTRTDYFPRLRATTAAG